MIRREPEPASEPARPPAPAAARQPAPGPPDASDADDCVVVFSRSGVEVRAQPDRMLLEVAEDHGVTIASLCRGGTCGTCKVRLISGRPRIDTLYALNVPERRAGWILTCSARTVAGERIVLDA